MRERARTRPQQCAVLESAYRVSGNPGEEEVRTLAQQTDRSPSQVLRWFRQRRRADLPNTLQKFCETGWRFTFYLAIFLYGLACLWTKPWFWDIDQAWLDYPRHKVDPDIWIYYMVELSFYWSLSFSQWFDVKRKDFWEMFIHHNATIALIMFSWTTHFIRIGTLVLIVHDCADPLLELAKLFRYAQYKRTCDAVFAVFSVLWVITRCGIYPGWILRSTLFDAIRLSSMFPAYYIFNGLLCLLQVLHIVWTYLLFKVLYKALTEKHIEDMRSDSEPSDDENDNEEHSKKLK